VLFFSNRVVWQTKPVPANDRRVVRNRIGISSEIRSHWFFFPILLNWQLLGLDFPVRPAKWSVETGSHSGVLPILSLHFSRPTVVVCWIFLSPDVLKL